MFYFLCFLWRIRPSLFCTIARSPVPLVSAVYSSVLLSKWTLEYLTVSTSDFHYKGAPRDTSCCWNRSWKAKHSEMLLFPLLFVTSWTLFPLIIIIPFLSDFSWPCNFSKFSNISMFWKSIQLWHLY